MLPFMCGDSVGDEKSDGVVDKDVRGLPWPRCFQLEDDRWRCIVRAWYGVGKGEEMDGHD